MNIRLLMRLACRNRYRDSDHYNALHEDRPTDDRHEWIWIAVIVIVIGLVGGIAG